ncbi:MAG: hypothetical protein IJU64_07025 [Bacilli bacterium]|nr:hypothetical protein [Bacilli bacterium]
MKDRTSVIFGNPLPRKTIVAAEKGKAKYIKKFGDDSKKEYHLVPVEIPTLSHMGVKNLVLAEQSTPLTGKPIIIGNIRMGFGHYRISMAIASCAKALGYDPYWFDLASFDATGSAMIRYQNQLYSTASKLSQKSHLFNHFFWEPLNSEGFRKLSYNAKDQKASELLAPLYHDFPKDTPFVATHCWPSQGAIHAEMTHVVNAIPDNWPMALHLSEGAIHAVQTPFAYLGYKMLNGMDKKPLKGMGPKDLYEVGCYVDHEIVSNVEHDIELRLKRRNNDEPLRILLSVGGAGAGAKQFLAMIKHLLPYVMSKKVALFLNFGDHLTMYDFLCKKIDGFEAMVTRYFNKYEEFTEFVESMDSKVIDGIYLFENDEIFQAVYSTNLLMRHIDLLVTKPSELVFYPVPKIFQRHIGGHEVYGAIYGREMGDATFECPDEKSMSRMLDTIIEDKDLYAHMCQTILKRKQEGAYDGGYKVVELAVKGRE